MTANISLPQGTNLTVIKQNIQGQETWRYHGRLVHQDHHSITLEAFFDREDMDHYGLPLRKGDRFVETYYTDRWYNIFEIHARENDQVRGWYCNIARPARLAGDTLSYIDLALDLLVFPDGRQIILDEDEFAALDLSDELRSQACQALSELQAFFIQRSGREY
jgi:hypothetical protein